MTSEWLIDPSTYVVLAATQADGVLSVPEQIVTNALNNPNNTGSFWFLSIDGNSVSIGTTNQAFGVNPVYGVGSYLTKPLFLEPGLSLHCICAGSKSATVSIIRARRAS
jgi:hypothetical protein